MSPWIPIVLFSPLITGLLALALPNRGQLRPLLGLGGSLVLLGAAIGLFAETADGSIAYYHFGEWPPPFAISYAADILSSLMVLVSAIVSLGTAIFAFADEDAAASGNNYHGFVHIMVFGVCAAFLTADLFHLFVAFEILLIASFALVVLKGGRAQYEGGLKYVALNLFASLMFLSGIGLLYGMLGSLNMADLAGLAAASDEPTRLSLAAVLLCAAFSIKAGLFPLYFWLPSSYHVPSATVSAIFAGLLTKVGVYALFRVIPLIFAADWSYFQAWLLPVANFTMVLGVFGAVTQKNLRRLLSFHIISQIGYIILGLALFTPLALAGAVLYLIHNILVKTNLFYIAGYIERLRGTGNLKYLGGLYKERPGLAMLFLLSALSLGGLPPLSGFWAKYMVVRAALEAGAPISAAMALFTGFFTLFCMMKVWTEVFWKKPPESSCDVPAAEAASDGATTTRAPLPRLPVFAAVFTIVLFNGLALAIGLYPEPLIQLAEQAARQLIDPSDYIQQVLGNLP
ncbi:MAG: proton-conducting transporter membrane subunit [Opitutales bacterium]